MAATVQVEGLRETIRSLSALGADATDLKDAWSAIGRIVTPRAADLAPRRTGSLASTIRAGRAKSKATIRAGSARVPYAAAVHWGSRHNPTPIRFLLDAAKDKQPEVLEAVDAELRALIHRLSL